MVLKLRLRVCFHQGQNFVECRMDMFFHQSRNTAIVPVGNGGDELLMIRQ